MLESDLSAYGLNRIPTPATVMGFSRKMQLSMSSLYLSHDTSHDI